MMIVQVFGAQPWPDGHPRHLLGTPMAPMTSPMGEPLCPLLDVDADLAYTFKVTCNADAAALATEVWGAATDGDLPEDVHSVHATTAAAMAEYQVCL